MRFVFGGDGARRLAKKVPDHSARDVFNIHDPLAQVRIVNCSESAAILLRHLVKGIFDIVPVAFEIAEDLVDERAVLDDKKVRVKNAGIFGADGVGNALLNFEKFGARGDEGGLKTRNFFGKFLGGNRVKGNLLVVQPVDKYSSVSDARRYRDTLETSFLLALGITSTHAATRSRFFLG